MVISLPTKYYGQDKGKIELQNPYQMGPSFTDTKKLDALREMQRLKRCWTNPNWHAGHLSLTAFVIMEALNTKESMDVS